MNLSDFNYDLPKELIAQHALTSRRDARLLVLDRPTGGITHSHFSRCAEHFRPGDLLVLNDTKVLPARFFAQKETGGKIELLLLRRIDRKAPSQSEEWEVLVKPSGRVKKGQRLLVKGRRPEDDFRATVLDEAPEDSGIRRLEFDAGLDMREQMEKSGRIPLPPYIDREDLPVDRNDYQTVYARTPGSVASPTAGLHFDEGLLEELRKRGVEMAFVTLHVGYGTFQSVTCEDITQHKMHSEYFSTSEDAVQKINRAKREKRRVIACGTTSLRVLEAASTGGNPAELEPKSGWTDLFIFPPYQFKMTDAIITNFHLPKTTLLMLVAAFCGMENWKRAYQEAIEKRYRFFSYGDAMMIQ